MENPHLNIETVLFTFYYVKKRSQASQYYTLPVFMGSQPVGRTIRPKQSKGAIRRINYMVKMTKTGQEEVSNASYLYIESKVEPYSLGQDSLILVAYVIL